MTLSQRIAALQGPDRAVDAEVAAALGLVPTDYERAVVHGGVMPYWWHSTVSKAPYWSPPAFTASLDAARSVVPEGSSIDITIDPDGVTEVGVTTDDDVACAAAATPALTLLSAAMKARGL